MKGVDDRLGPRARPNATGCGTAGGCIIIRQRRSVQIWAPLGERSLPSGSVSHESKVAFSRVLATGLLASHEGSHADSLLG